MKNSFEVRGEAAVIFIESPKYGLFEVEVDKEDLSTASNHPGTWAVCKSNPQEQFYVVSTIKVNGKKSTLYLARLILGLEGHHEVFYADKNGLNLKKSNIRPSYMYKRQQNRRDNKNINSGVRGVHWCNQTRKWRAVLRVDGKYKNLGRFATVIEAELAVQAAISGGGQ